MQELLANPCHVAVLAMWVGWQLDDAYSAGTGISFPL
jgi:hypothetical protein